MVHTSIDKKGFATKVKKKDCERTEMTLVRTLGGGNNMHDLGAVVIYVIFDHTAVDCRLPTG